MNQEEDGEHYGTNQCDDHSGRKSDSTNQRPSLSLAPSPSPPQSPPAPSLPIQATESIQTNKNSNSAVMTDSIDDIVLPSSLGSSPPGDFEVNIISPLPSLAGGSPTSSISIDSNQEFIPSPILLTDQMAIKCPVCDRFRSTFYCSNCIHDGNFVQSNCNLPERFAEKKLKLLKCQQENKHLDDSFQNMTKDHFKRETLHLKLRNLGANIKLLSDLLDEQKKKLEETKQKYEHNKALLNVDKVNKSRDNKLQLIKHYIADRKRSIEKRDNIKLATQGELKNVLQERVYQLTADIFPIDEIELNEHNGSGHVNMETSPLLTFSESSQLHINNPTAYSIVEPWLPMNGDYSAYSLWINDHKDMMPGSLGQLGERNAAFRITAALTYVTQLVNNLAYQLDVLLPSKLSHNTFNSDILTDNQFSYNVAKLNINVIHLCLSQGIDISLLNPRRTTKNLLLLFDPNICALGRHVTFELDDEDLCKRIDDCFASDVTLITEDIYDPNKQNQSDEISDSEWELSDAINAMDMQSVIEHSSQQNASFIQRPLKFLTSFWTTN